MSSHSPPGNHTKYDSDEDLPQQPDLSVKEQGVFHWMLQGKRDTEIAVLTSANPRTTEKHSASILFKYKVETRTGAIGAYYEIELARERREKELLQLENAKMKMQLAQIKRALERT